MKKEQFKDYKKIKFEHMYEYLMEKSEEERKAFKLAVGTDGKYNHLIAKKWFYEKYFPEYIPQKKVKAVNAIEMMKDW